MEETPLCQDGSRTTLVVHASGLHPYSNHLSPRFPTESLPRRTVLPPVESAPTPVTQCGTVHPRRKTRVPSLFRKCSERVLSVYTKWVLWYTP